MITKKSRIFLSGHNGMVGSAILRKLKNLKYKNIFLKNRKQLDLRNQSKVYKYLSKIKPEVVIIASAKVGGIEANNNLRAEFIFDNLSIQNNLIDGSYKNGVKNLIFLGSSCVYPKESKQPIKEEYLLSNYLLKKNPNSKVVTCVNSGNSIDEIVTQTNSTVIRTKVGSVEVSRKMITENALLGFEENGGFMFGKHNHVRDGGMTLALFLELLASSNKSMSEELATLPPSFTTKDKISCEKEDADKIISKLLAEFPNADTTDGIKIVFDKKNWVMVRPSGTEPIIRIYVESDSEKNLEILMKEYIQKINSFLDREHF